VYWPGEALVVLDRVRGADREAVLTHIPLDPACAFERGWITSAAGPLRLAVLRGTTATALTGSESPRDGWVSEGFGRPRARTSISIAADAEGRTAYAILPGDRSVEIRAGLCVILGVRGDARVATDCVA
jgi:hypothetical protein